MIQYLFLKSALSPTRNGTFFFFSSSVSFCRTRSSVPKKVNKNAMMETIPKTKNVFVHADALFPKNSTIGNVKVLMKSVPAVASKFLKILKTDRSYGSCVIKAFNAEYGTLIAV